MVQKAPIRNEHREAYRNGELQDIPNYSLELLNALYPHEKGQNGKTQKADKKTKEVKSITVDDGA